MSAFPISIVGATGMVGSTLLGLLEQQLLPVADIHLVASQSSAGKSVSFKGKMLQIEALDTFDFSRSKIAFFCVGNDLAATYAPVAAKLGNMVIDKSYYFRNHEDVPLIVPEVNLHALASCKKLNIIANPNCNTIPVAVGLKPIYDAVGITRINIATYQSVSGTGKEGIAELTAQTKQILNGDSITPHVYPHQIAFNVIPQIDDFLENGYTREEMKIVWEMQKIFSDESIAINPTAVRTPVLRGHAAAVHIETKDKLSAKQACQLLENAPGIKLMVNGQDYPSPARDAANQNEVYIGRVREDLSHPKGLNLWIVADNLRKGAALNAIQIANHLIGQRLLS